MRPIKRNRKELLLAGGLALVTASAFAQSEVKVWSKRVGANSYDFGYAVATDPAGNVVVAGATQSSLGGQNAGRYDLFVSKYDSSGNKLWLTQRGTGEREFAEGVATDAAGNIYVTGYTGDALDGNNNLGTWDIFLMKFDANGNWLWTRQDGTGQEDEGKAVCVDQFGNIYITGYVKGNFHGITRVGSSDIFISKYSSSGARLWSALFGSTAVDEGFGIACDPNGNVFVTGYCQESIEGNPWLGSGDNVLAKYDPNGQRLWLRQWGTFNADTGHAVATDAEGNALVAGYSNGTLYGTDHGGREIFLAKYNAAGDFVWGVQDGNTETDQAWGVTVDAAQNIFLACEAGGPLQGNTHAGGPDVYLAKYSSGGSLLWSSQLGTADNDVAAAVCVNTNGGVFVTGWSYADFDGSINQGLNDAILLKFAPSNSPPPAPTANVASNVTSYGFVANWKPAMPATGYRLDVSLNSSFSSYLAGYQNLDVGNTFSRALGGLSPGTTYYSRVRAYNANGTSVNSAVIMTTTVVVECSPAVLLNGSFEGSNDGSGVGTNWTSYLRAPNPAIALWSIQTAAPVAGTGARYQQIALTNAAGGGGVRQVVTGCSPGAAYRVSGYMRGNSASATTRVKCSPSASTDWTTAVDLNPPQFASTNNWVAFSGTVVAASTNMTLWLDGTVSGSGNFKAACFDAVTVSCTVTSVPLRLAAFGAPANLPAQLKVVGTAGNSVTFQHSSNLVDWVAFTNVVNASGTLQVADPLAPNQPLRFYRAKSP